MIWQHTLSTTLRFDIQRDTLGLLPNPLKLVVMQRVIPDDPDGNPSNPRLGAVYLNLAEYVGQGSVERRYLLRESKTNATLKLTIELEHIGGETQYIPPPLPKGEILTGIAGFLENDAYRKRPRELDLYGPYQNQEELEFDLLGGPLRTVRAPKTAKSRHADISRDLDQDVDADLNQDGEEEGEGEGEGEAFDVHRLHVAYGPKTTEALIEALFNPVKTSEKRRESPFTYYEPKTKKPSASESKKPVGLGLSIPDLEGEGEKDATIGRRAGSNSNPTHITYTPLHPSIEGSMKKKKNQKAGSVCSASTTSSSSASVRTTSSSSAKSKKSSPSVRSSVNHVHAAPEGRVVVEKDGVVHGGVVGAGLGLDAHLDGGGGHGVRAWWRKVASRPGTPTLR